MSPTSLQTNLKKKYDEQMPFLTILMMAQKTCYRNKIMPVFRSKAQFRIHFYCSCNTVSKINDFQQSVLY